MTLHRTCLSRRSLLATSAAFAALGGTGALARTSSVALANRLSALAGVDVMPRDLLVNLQRALGPDEIALLGGEGRLPDNLRMRVLEGLYSGVLPAPQQDAVGTRIAFSTALMWAAIEETNNTISYCGGLPHFWSEPPQVS